MVHSGKDSYDPTYCPDEECLADHTTLRARVEELEKENKHLKRQLETKDNALRHYADPKNIAWPHIKEDGGRIARAALEGKCWKDTNEARSLVDGEEEG